jgi:protein transport protein SEC20
MAEDGHLSALAVRTERVIANTDADDKLKRTALMSLRRAIDLAKARQENVGNFETTLRKLETKFKNELADRAVKSTANYAAKREALLSSKDAQPRGEVLGRADLLAQSRDATESLARTRNLMMKEVSRFGEVNSILVADSEKLRAVGNEYTEYGSTLQVSQNLTKNMQRREQTDRILLGFGFLFFLAVVLYILKRRLMPFFSPIGWFVEFLAAYAVNSSVNTTTSMEDSKQL